MSNVTIRFNEKFAKYEGLVDAKVTTRCKTVAKVVRALTADGAKSITSDDAKITAEIKAAQEAAAAPKADKKAKKEAKPAPVASEPSKTEEAVAA